MKIIAFGASVTKQDRDHKTGEVRGYIPNLRAMLAQLSPLICLEAIGLGSSFFSSGGYALLPSVLEKKPDILIFEWHSTGEDSFDQLLLESAFMRFDQARLPVLITILPKRDFLISKRQPNSIEQVLQYQSDTIRIVDLYEDNGSLIDIDTDFRDNVHTSAAGGKKYASLIYRSLVSLIDIVNSRSSNNAYELIECSQERRALPVPVNSALLCSNFSECTDFAVLLHCTSSGPVRIILDLMVGPFSPVMSLYLNNQLFATNTLWDKWCNYERQCFKQVAYFKSLPGNASHILSFKKESNDPDYSACKKRTEWPAAEGRFIKLRSIYCIGNALPQFLDQSGLSIT